jgi:Dyp-type peroxidase family
MTAPEVGQQVPEEAKLPLRSSTDIQGNILAPFYKPHQAFLFLNFKNNQAGARGWLAELTDPADTHIATTAEVADYNKQYKEWRKYKEGAAGEPPQPPETKVWMNVGLTCSGLLTLHPELAPDLAVYEAFWQGPLGERRDNKGQVTTTAALLGDKGLSAPEKWAIGNPGQRPVDAIVTIAGDPREELGNRVVEERELAERFGLKVLPVEVEGRKDPALEQRGDKLVGEKLIDGQDHFGFKDNVSQPGIRGFTEEDPDAPGEDKDHPGSLIIAAGEFLLGRRGEQRREPRPRQPAVPAWMRDGSFQVFRRLTQDVECWNAVMNALAQTEQLNGLTQEPGLEAKASALKARAIGRWPSGKPLTPARDADGQETEDSNYFNNFTYNGDDEGYQTPCFAHIRKMNPRDDGLFRDRAHRILRRGITFAVPFVPAKEDSSGKERGLLFNAYMASIEDQFEFLQQRWANDPEVPASYRQEKPIKDELKDGPDPLIGASKYPCLLRSKEDATAKKPPIKLNFHTLNPTNTAAGDVDPEATPRPFVYTTGAVYAFAPTMSALRRLSRPDPMRDG